MDEIDEVQRILPAWFVGRMMDDEWSFGLLLSCGVVLAISNIRRMHQAADGTVWLDVWMLDRLPTWAENLPMKTIVAPTERLIASINAAHVVWAFELADT